MHVYIHNDDINTFIQCVFFILWACSCERDSNACLTPVLPEFEGLE